MTFAIHFLGETCETTKSEDDEILVFKENH